MSSDPQLQRDATHHPPRLQPTCDCRSDRSTAECQPTLPEYLAFDKRPQAESRDLYRMITPTPSFQVALDREPDAWSGGSGHQASRRLRH